MESCKIRNDLHTKTVAETMDPATNKKTRSFLRKDGTIKFIEQPCELCDKIGKKDEWHFSFECATRDKITTMIIDTAESDSDEEALPGVI